MSAKIRPNCLNFSFIALLLLFFQPGLAQNRFANAAAIVTTAGKRLKKEPVLLVANRDTVLFQQDTKSFNALRGQASLGAASQWLTAALVMLMVDEGKLSLTDPVSRYLPEFTAYGKSYITIGHCLSHFTGIQPDGGKVGRLFDKKKFANLEEKVHDYVKKEIKHNAGEAFRYNGMGPDIAGRVLEVATKKKFDMLAQQKLFRPLGMRQTTFGTLDGSALSPSDGARGTAADYTRFLRMLLNGGMHQGQRILSEASVNTLRTIVAPASAIGEQPEVSGGWAYAPGAWAPGATADAPAAVLTAPSFAGTTAHVDFCRGYAFMYLQQELDEREKRVVGSQLQKTLEPLFPARCP